MYVCLSFRFYFSLFPTSSGSCIQLVAVVVVAGGDVGAGGAMGFALPSVAATLETYSRCLLAELVAPAALFVVAVVVAQSWPPA